MARSSGGGGGSGRGAAERSGRDSSGSMNDGFGGSSPGGGGGSGPGARERAERGGLMSDNVVGNRGDRESSSVVTPIGRLFKDPDKNRMAKFQELTPDQQFVEAVNMYMDRGIIDKDYPDPINAPQEVQDTLYDIFQKTQVWNWRDTVKQFAGRSSQALTEIAVGGVTAGIAPALFDNPVANQIAKQFAGKAIGRSIGGKVKDRFQSSHLTEAIMRSRGMTEEQARQASINRHPGQTATDQPTAPGKELSPNQSQTIPQRLTTPGKLVPAHTLSNTTSLAAPRVSNNYAQNYRRSRLSGRQSVVNQLLNARGRT